MYYKITVLLNTFLVKLLDKIYSKENIKMKIFVSEARESHVIFSLTHNYVQLNNFLTIHKSYWWTTRKKKFANLAILIKKILKLHRVIRKQHILSYHLRIIYKLIWRIFIWACYASANIYEALFSGNFPNELIAHVRFSISSVDLDENISDIFAQEFSKLPKYNSAVNFAHHSSHVYAELVMVRSLNVSNINKTYTKQYCRRHGH